MSMTKRYIEDLVERYLESHPEMSFEEVMEKLVKGEIMDENAK